ncbi:MAG: RlmE family RNA methyltransferase [Oligoflexia bacterium]|nr:RlmE family RNA methyltransferase [Oligoflexia bacterium]
MRFKVNDHFFKKAKKENFLARSVYKLEEIDKKYRIISSNAYIVDLGYFPGSWIQYSLSKIGKNGLIVGVDIQEINQQLQSHPQVHLFKKSIEEIDSIIGDIFGIVANLAAQTGKSTTDKNFNSNTKFNGMFDVILSDMAPKTTGIKIVDQENSLNLVKTAFSLAPTLLARGGNLVVKVFESQSAQNFLKVQKIHFKESHFLRPASTRSCSKEYFFIGKGYIPQLD